MQWHKNKYIKVLFNLTDVFWRYHCFDQFDRTALLRSAKLSKILVGIKTISNF